RKAGLFQKSDERMLGDGELVDQIIGPSKERTIVKARALVCYRGVRESGMTMTEVARHLKIALSTASSVVKKGKKIARDQGLSIKDILNANK
ncbi:MAG: transposase, partial [Desulfatirhabdiaceae bacterium]